MTTTLWPLQVLTNEEEARRYVTYTLHRYPDLRADGIGTDGPPLTDHLVAVAVCYDFLLAVRARRSIDDRHTSADLAADVETWALRQGLVVKVPHGALIAAAVGQRFTAQQVGIGAYFNMRRSDVERRLTPKRRS